MFCVSQYNYIIRQIHLDMRNSLILLFLFLSLTISGSTYYVSPGGSDSNPGTISQPFFTLNKAWSQVSAGDVIYMRGGTYNYTTRQALTYKDGTSGNLINVLAYPNESPVLDFTSSSDYFGVFLRSSDYIHIKGIKITNVIQPDPPVNGNGIYGLMLWDDVNNCTFEQMDIDHIGGWGVVIYDNCSNILFLNCDSHHNQDPYSTNPYGGSDGFECGSLTSTGITFRGCRAWSNSDDGWDMRLANGLFTLENCWSFRNGYIPGTNTQAGNGEGIKLGGTGLSGTRETRRIVKNCLTFENLLTGIEAAPDDGGSVGVEVYNTVSYKNGEGMNFNYTGLSILRNNISYNNGGNTDNIRTAASCTHDHNSFDLSVTVTNADFVSVSSVGTDGPRQSDGSLPVINFLKLATGSKLIDAGVNVGILYGGNAPDLGAFEMQIGTTNPIPVFTSAIVENTTPSLLGMTYDLNLNNLVVPSASAFAVRVNSIVKTVNTVVISGSKVQLTLASAIKFGDIVTVSYTKPASNPLQTVTGEQAISISAQSIINNLINPTKDVTPGAITMTITPNHIHRIINILLQYTSSFSVLDPAMSPQIIRIFNISGKLFLEKLLVTGAANIKLPINLSSGIYTVLMFSGGLQMASQKIIVY